MNKTFWKIYLGLSFVLWTFLGVYIGIHVYNSVAIPAAIAVAAWGIFHGTNTIIWAALDRIYLERSERIDAIRAEAVRYLWDADLSHSQWTDRDSLRKAIDEHLNNYLNGRIKLRKP